jgi:hypothetical protein
VTAVAERPAETGGAFPDANAQARRAELYARELAERLGAVSLDLVLSRMRVREQMEARVQVDGTELHILVGFKYVVPIDGLVEAPHHRESNGFWEDLQRVLETAIDDVFAGRNKECKRPVVVVGSICDDATDLMWRLVPEAFRAVLEDHPTVYCTQWATRQDDDGHETR